MTAALAFGRRLVNALTFWVSGFIPRRPNLYVFGAWRGKRYSDNSKYLFEYLAEKEPSWELVWIGDESLRDQVPMAANTSFVEFGSARAIWTCARAGTCFQTHGSGDLWRFSVLRGARRFYLGHGIAMKNMGAGELQDDGRVRSWLRAAWLSPKACTHWVASSGAHRDKLLSENRRALITHEQIIETGQPRLDLLFADRTDSARRDAIRLRLEQRHGLPRGAALITYLPTFRDSGQPAFSFRDLAAEQHATLGGLLENHGAWIFEKAHFADAAQVAPGDVQRRPWLLDIADADQIDTQELLLASDVLITDYSGCFIDFLAVDRPIIHFAYDYETYRDHDRGLYFDLDEYGGGAIASTFDDLVSAVALSLEDPDRDKSRRHQLQQMLLQWEDGNARERTTDFLRGLR